MTATKTAAPKVDLSTASAINKAIDSVTKRGAKLQSEVHAIAVACAAHADKHGDVTLMQRLLSGLPGSMRKNALLAWAIEFGPFSLDETGKSVGYAKGTGDLVSGAKIPFWEFQPEPAFKPFNLNEALAAMLKKADAAAKDSRNAVDAGLLIKLSALRVTE